MYVYNIFLIYIDIICEKWKLRYGKVVDVYLLGKCNVDMYVYNILLIYIDINCENEN
jgi:hypothetical protein